MELKPINLYLVTFRVSAFNRTFMELKHLNLGADYLVAVAFNRTFMELKLNYGKWMDKATPSLLIAPLWN